MQAIEIFSYERGSLQLFGEAPPQTMSTDFFTSIPPELSWVFLLASVFIENIFPPYPGDSIVVFSGYLAHSGHLSFLSIGVAITVGNLTSAALMYYFGERVMEFFLARIKSPTLKEVFSTDHLVKTHDWFNKYGLAAVVFSRFSAGIRFFVAIVAGMVRMHIALFLAAFFIATLIWNTVLVGGGYLLGKNWEEMLIYIRIYSGFIALGLFLAALLFLLKFAKKNRNKTKPF